MMTESEEVTYCSVNLLIIGYHVICAVLTLELGDELQSDRTCSSQTGEGWGGGGVKKMRGPGEGRGGL